MSSRLPIALLAAASVFACSDPSPTTGSLVVTVDGLPSGAAGSVRLTGPSAFSRTVAATTTFEDLEPGEYIVRIDTVTIASNRWGVPVTRDTIQLQRGQTENVRANYGIASGGVQLTITGLPPGIPADVRLTGNGYNATIVSSTTLIGLRPGRYYIASDTMVSIQGDRFGAPKILDSVDVSASLTPAAASVAYTLVSGTLSIQVSGLPSGSLDPQQPIRVTGPAGFSAFVGNTAMLRGLRAGSYTITASNASGVCPNTYVTNNAPQSRDVVIGDTSEIAIAYSETQANPADLNLRIDGAHVVQVTQDYAGAVPILANKPALLRVFGVANQCNTAQPAVRVTLSNGDVITRAASETSVRRQAAESVLVASWNFPLTAAQVQAGLTFVAELDPANQVAEVNEGDNRFPATGAKAVDVRNGPTVGIRFVSVTQSANGLTGDVTAANVQSFMDYPRRLFPISNYDVDIRTTPYTTSTAALGSQGANWSQLLSEISTLRTAQDQSNRYYYGVVKVSYQSGVAGIAYVPGKAALGWDYLPSGSSIAAHELGHSFGRSHTPCGNPQGIDPNYPSTGFYSGGRIGVYGYDLTDGSLKAADQYTDIMGYCNLKWISDYTYVGIYHWLMDPNRGPSLGVSSGAEQPSLLIWGRIVDGQPILEPAFEISARPQLPSAPGPHRIAALDASGAELFSMSFSAQQVADIAGNEQSFAFTVPLSALRGGTLATLRLTTATGRAATSIAAADIAADPEVSVQRAGDRGLRVRWDAARFPVVMVRDATSGDILSFARGGDVTVRTRGSELDLNFSNRLRSTRKLERAR